MTAYTDFHYSPTGSGVISGAQVLEQTEQGINGLGQYVQDNVSGAIDVANEALTTAQSADSNATTAINLANSFNAQIIAANQTAGNALTTAQSAQNTANSASSLATTANNNAATALNTANAASSAVTTLTGTVNSLGNRMTAAENAINTNAGNITTLQNGLATTNANVTAAANAASAAQATATSAQSTATLTRNQAYVLRYTGTTITGGGTIAYADIDNTDNIKAGDKIIDISGAIYAIASVDTANQTVTVGASPVINLFCDAENLIPVANDAYDLGSSSYQWNNLYAKNYYYNGTAWGLDKANVWTKNNTFSADCIVYNSDSSGSVAGLKLRNSKAEVLSTGNTSSDQSMTFRDKNDVAIGYVRGAVQSASVALKIGAYAKDSSNNTVNTELQLLAYTNGNKAVIPSANNSYDLGSSSYQWNNLYAKRVNTQSVNGVNPGALSLPVTALKNTYDISGNITDLTGGNNSITAARTGWIFVKSDNATEISIENTITGMGASDHSAVAATLMVSIPVTSGEILNIIANCTSIDKAYLLPCQGNV